MALTDADFAWRFACGKHVVTIECDRRTCYAYLGPATGSIAGDCWLFNLVDAPDDFEPSTDGPPVNDRDHARPFDGGRTVDPAAFEVCAERGEFLVWYRSQPIGRLFADGRRGQSVYATASNSLVDPLDARAALRRHWDRANATLGRVLDVESERFSADEIARWRELLDHNEFGVVLDDLILEEERLLPQSCAEIRRVLPVQGEEMS